MPELGSKISLISRADIRYEGRLFTVDPQECTIALASVRSFGTEERETQCRVGPQNQVYDYILFRGSDIKDIRVVDNVAPVPNDPAIMQMSVPPTLGSGPPPGQFVGHYNHPVVGQQQYQQYHPMAGFQGGMHPPVNKTSELSPQVPEMLPAPIGSQPIGSQPLHPATHMKDQGSMLDLIGGGVQQNNSRSNTPGFSANRKSPTADQGTQVGAGRGDARRVNNVNKQQPPIQNQQQQQQQNQRQRTNSRNRQRYPSGSSQPNQANVPPAPNAPQPQQPQPQPQHHSTPAQYNYHQGQQYNRGGGWRGGRSRGRGRGFVPRNNGKTLKFENDYDFEQANTEFEELRSKLAKAKISDNEVKTDGNVTNNDVEVEKKEDSGNETGAGEAEVEEDRDDYTGYDKTKSFFDNISCEAVERSKGRSQRTDWRTERKLNSETFGVASARRGAWRGRGGWRYNAPHHSGEGGSFNVWSRWRPNNMRGGRGRPNNGIPTPLGQPAQQRQNRNIQPQPQPATAN